MQNGLLKSKDLSVAGAFQPSSHSTCARITKQYGPNVLIKCPADNTAQTMASNLRSTVLTQIHYQQAFAKIATAEMRGQNDLYLAAEFIT